VRDTTEFIIPPAALRLVRLLRRRDKKNTSLLAMTVFLLNDGVSALRHSLNALYSGDTILNSQDKVKK
jgi:hypothetical protein